MWLSAPWVIDLIGMESEDYIRLLKRGELRDRLVDRGGIRLTREVDISSLPTAVRRAVFEKLPDLQDAITVAQVQLDIFTRWGLPEPNASAVNVRNSSKGGSAPRRRRSAVSALVKLSDYAPSRRSRRRKRS
jgi:hypothetical protein